MFNLATVTLVATEPKELAVAVPAPRVVVPVVIAEPTMELTAEVAVVIGALITGIELSAAVLAAAAVAAVLLIKESNPAKKSSYHLLCSRVL